MSVILCTSVTMYNERIKRNHWPAESECQTWLHKIVHGTPYPKGRGKILEVILLCNFVGTPDFWQCHLLNTNY